MTYYANIPGNMFYCSILSIQLRKKYAIKVNLNILNLNGAYINYISCVAISLFVGKIATWIMHFHRNIQNTNRFCSLQPNSTKLRSVKSGVSTGYLAFCILIQAPRITLGCTSRRTQWNFISINFYCMLVIFSMHINCKL